MTESDLEPTFVAMHVVSWYTSSPHFKLCNTVKDIMQQMKPSMRDIHFGVIENMQYICSRVFPGVKCLIDKTKQKLKRGAWIFLRSLLAVPIWFKRYVLELNELLSYLPPSAQTHFLKWKLYEKSIGELYSLNRNILVIWFVFFWYVELTSVLSDLQKMLSSSLSWLQKPRRRTKCRLLWLERKSTNESLQNVT